MPALHVHTVFALAACLSGLAPLAHAQDDIAKPAAAKHSANELMRQAQLALDVRDLEGAEAALRAALDHEPDHRAARFMLAQTLNKAGRVKEADGVLRAWYQLEVARDLSRTTRAAGEIGDFWHALGVAPQALSWYALLHYPTVVVDGQRYLRLAALLEAEGEVAMAYAITEQVADLRGTDAAAFALAGLDLAQLEDDLQRRRKVALHALGALRLSGHELTRQLREVVEIALGDQRVDRAMVGALFTEHVYATTMDESLAGVPGILRATLTVRDTSVPGSRLAAGGAEDPTKRVYCPIACDRLRWIRTAGDEFEATVDLAYDLQLPRILEHATPHELEGENVCRAAIRSGELVTRKAHQVSASSLAVRIAETIHEHCGLLEE